MSSETPGPTTAVELTFEEIQLGQSAAFKHHISADDVSRFALVTGDRNPLHVDPEYAGKTSYGRPIVHGMFLAGLLSRLVGMHLPGRRCLYLSQSLDFCGPVFIGDEVEVAGTVVQKQDAARILVIRTEVLVNPGRRVAVRGKAYVGFLNN